MNNWSMESLDYLLMNLPAIAVPPEGKFFSDALCTAMTLTSLMALATRRWLSAGLLWLLVGFHLSGPSVDYGQWRELVEWAQPLLWAVIIINFGHFAYHTACFMGRGLGKVVTIVAESNEDVDRFRFMEKALAEGQITPEEASKLLERRPLYNFRPRKPKSYK